MTLMTHVPSDVEAGSLADLLTDCRRVREQLSVAVPLPRKGVPAAPVVIDLATVEQLRGYEPYGC